MAEQEPRDPETNFTSPSLFGWWWIWLLLLLALIVGFGGWGWWGMGGPKHAVSVRPEAESALAKRVGETVTITGQLSKTLGPHTFLLTGDVAGEHGILVFSRQPLNELPISVSADKQTLVQVQGKIEKFDKDNLEKEIGVKLDDKAFSALRGRAIIVAQAVMPLVPAESNPEPAR